MRSDAWQSRSFLTEARALIESHVGVTGEIEQPHVRPWSTALRVPTSDGDVWFKAALPGVGHEVAVTATLARLRPDLVLAPLAVDRERIWMLLPEGGERLRELLEREPHPRPWYDLLPAYADLQLVSSPEADRLVAAGVPDFRLERVPAAAERLAAAFDEPAPPQDAVVRLCERLAAFGIPETIQHDDLHDGNVFVREDGYRIFDWGDSAVMHPFASLVVAFGGIAHRFGLGENDPDIERLRDLYLERFAAYGRVGELREAAVLARTLGMLSRADAWWRVASMLADPGEMSE